MILTIEHAGVKRTIEGAFVLRGYRTDIEALLEALRSAKQSENGMMAIHVPMDGTGERVVTRDWHQAAHAD